MNKFRDSLSGVAVSETPRIDLYGGCFEEYSSPKNATCHPVWGNNKSYAAQWHFIYLFALRLTKITGTDFHSRSADLRGVNTFIRHKEHISS